MLKLVIEDDEGKQTVVPLIRDEITIGRKEGNTIRLTERNVSRRHARLTKVNGGVFVEDVESRYGIKLNGSKIDGKAKMDFGDEVLIGDYRLRIQDEARQKQEEATQLRSVEELAEQAGPQPIPPAQQARLVVISSNFAGQEFPIARTEMVIGRNAECDIIIDHRSVSGTHAKITRAPNGIFKVVDLKSANGVKVNGAQFSVKELNSGEIIELGHVRFRFCAPGELWSFQLAAGLMDDIRPPGGKGKIIALLAIIALLVVGLVAFVLLSQQQKPAEKPKAESTETTDPGKGIGEEAIEVSPGVDRDKFDSLILRCDDHFDRGEFEAALDACKQALQLDPSNRLAQSKHDGIMDEMTLKSHYDAALNYLDANECELALVEIDSVTDENSWTARKILKDDLRNKAQNCIHDSIADDAQQAIDAGDATSAEEYIAELKNKSPNHVRIAVLEESLKASQKSERPDRDRSDRGDKKDRGDKDDKEDKGDKGDKGGGNEEEAQALADKAKKLILSNPSKAADLYKQALKIKNNAKWRGSYAFALERAGKVCPAYKEYKKVVSKLSGSAAKRAERGIEKYQSKCE